MVTTRIVAGNRARVTFELDIAGVAEDPGTLTLLARHRSGRGAVGPFSWTNAAPGDDIVRDAQGRFHADLRLATPGVWDWRYAALDDADAPLAATEGTIILESLVIR